MHIKYHLFSFRNWQVQLQVPIDACFMYHIVTQWNLEVICHWQPVLKDNKFSIIILINLISIMMLLTDPFVKCIQTLNGFEYIWVEFSIWKSWNLLTDLTKSMIETLPYLKYNIELIIWRFLLFHCTQS